MWRTLTVTTIYITPAGILDDGKPDVIYLLIFFTDEFQEKTSVNNVRTICGMYSLLFNVSHHKRALLGSPRKLVLVPYGQDAYHTENIIIDDIVKGYIEVIPYIVFWQTYQNISCSNRFLRIFSQNCFNIRQYGAFGFCFRRTLQHQKTQKPRSIAY